jgi:DNA-binding transcriptional ArsR family regulator
MYDLEKGGVFERVAEDQAKYCSVFSNTRRIQILWALAESELSVGTIAEVVGSSLQNVSQHLSLMKTYNLVESRREGHTIYYRIKKECLVDHCLGLLQVVNPELAIRIQDL